MCVLGDVAERFDSEAPLLHAPAHNPNGNTPMVDVSGGGGGGGGAAAGVGGAQAHFDLDGPGRWEGGGGGAMTALAAGPSEDGRTARERLRHGGKAVVAAARMRR